MVARNVVVIHGFHALPVFYSLYSVPIPVRFRVPPFFIFLTDIFLHFLSMLSHQRSVRYDVE